MQLDSECVGKSTRWIIGAAFKLDSVADKMIWSFLPIAVYVAFYIIMRLLAYLLRNRTTTVEDILRIIISRVTFAAVLALTVVNVLEATSMLPTTIVGAPQDYVLGRVMEVILVWAVAIVSIQIIVLVDKEYSDKWAGTRKGELVLPFLRLFGPITAVAVAIWDSLQDLVMLFWNMSFTDMLIGAGFLGIVLGLALQDNLSNFFSGLSLLLARPFRRRDWIVLADGKICRVEKIGLRATELYNVEEHSIVYVPNNELANSATVNITKPTVDLKVAIDVGVGYGSQLTRVKDVLEEIAWGHPNVLVSDTSRKLKALTALVQRVQSRAQDAEIRVRKAKKAQLTKRKRSENIQQDKEHEEKNELHMYELWTRQARNYEKAIPKLREQEQLNRGLLQLEETMKDAAKLTDKIRKSDAQSSEYIDLCNRVRNFFEEALRLLPGVATCLNSWLAIPDEYIEPDEADEERKRWNGRKEDLQDYFLDWQAYRDSLWSPRSDQVMKKIEKWLIESIVPRWKDPNAKFMDFGASSVDLRLTFYIDDIRLEHFERRQRVTTDIANEIHARFAEENIEIPFPQSDVHFKEPLSDGRDKDKWIPLRLGK